MWSTRSANPVCANERTGISVARRRSAVRIVCLHSLETEERNLVARGFSDPQSICQAIRRLTVAARGQPGRAAVWRRQWELGDRAVRRHPANDSAFSKPDVAIGTDSDVDWRSGLTRDRKLGNLTLHRDAADAVAIRLASIHRPGQLDEPHMPVGAGRNVAGPGIRPWQRELGDDALRRDATDLAGVEFGEPDVAVRSRGQGARAAVRRGDREFGDLAIDRDAADLAAGKFSEPDVAVGAERDRARHAVRRRNRGFRDRP